MADEKSAEVRDLGKEMQQYIQDAKAQGHSHAAAPVEFLETVHLFTLSVVQEVKALQSATRGATTIITALLNRLNVDRVILAEAELQKAKQDVETNPFEVHQVGERGSPDSALLVARMGVETPTGKAN